MITTGSARSSPEVWGRPDLPLAVIVGAGAMGAAIARRIGATHRLIVADRDKARLDDLCAQLRAEGHDAAAHVCDLTSAQHVDALARAAAGFRTLVHVAALSPSMADWRTILAVNWLGARRVEAAFHAQATKGSAAIFISSLAAHAPPPDAGTLAALDTPDRDGDDPIAALERATSGHASSDAYRLSKLAMNRMCRRRAAAWGARGARIVSLSPGLIATPMGALEFKGSPEKRALYDQSPMQREGTMIEIAAATEFLSSDGASFISGTDLLVDGGLAAALQFPELP